MALAPPGASAPPGPSAPPLPPKPAPLVLLLGRTRTDRRRVLSEYQYVDAYSRPVFLYITAGRLKADLVRDAFAEHPTRPPAFLPEAVPWGQWRDRLVRRFGDGRAVVEGVARELLMGRVWRIIRPEMRRWAGLPDTPPARRALIQLAERWGMAHRGATPPAVASPRDFLLPGELAAGRRSSRVPDALRHDAALLFRSWTAILEASAGWTDRPTAVRATLRRLRRRPPGLLRSLRRFRSLLVDDLIALPPLEEELLVEFVAAFREAVPDGPVHLCLEGGARQRDAEAFFRATEEVDRGLSAGLSLRRSWSGFLTSGAVAKRVDAEPDRVDLADLLSEDGRVPAPALDLIGGVRIRRYPGESQEVVAIARAVKAAIRGGRVPERMWVALPKLDRYLPLVRDAFRAYGLPISADRGDPLIGSPPVSAAVRLLRAAAEGVDREVLRAITGSGRLRFRVSLDPESIRVVAEQSLPEDSTEAERQAHQSSLLAAIERRCADTAGIPARMDRLYRAAVETGTDGSDPLQWPGGILAVRLRRAPRDEEGWDTLADLLLDAWAMGLFTDRLEELAAAPDIPSVAARFRALLEDVGLGASEDVAAEDGWGAEERVVEEAERFAAAALRRLHDEISTVVGAVEAVRHAVDAWRPSAPGAEEPRPIDLFREALEGAVRGATFRGGEARAGVHVVGVRDVQGVDCPWLWVAGLVDGEFPRPVERSSLLPADVERLVPAPDPAEQDRAVFASLLRNAGHGSRRTKAVLILSAPATVAGAAVVPSAALQDLSDLRLEDGSGEASLGGLQARLQEQEEARLPPILSLKELLATPEEAARVPGAIPAGIREELERHRVLARERSDPAGFGRFDGVLGAGRAHRDVARAWTRELLHVRPGPDGRPELPMHVSGLESFARCPIRFFFDAVLQSTEVEEFQPDPPGREEGILLHAVLEQLYQERLRAHGDGRIDRVALTGAGVQELAGVKERARDLCHELAPRRLGRSRSPWRRQLLARITAGLVPDDPAAGAWEGPLSSFLDEERSLEFLGLDPALLEWRFDGVEPARAASRFDGGPPEGPSDVRLGLRGVVDRVDRPTGEPGLGGARLAVLDYKTGRLTSPADRVDRGLALQPVLYTAAVLEQEPEPTLGGVVAGYLVIDDSERTARKSLIGDPEVLDAVQAEKRASTAFKRSSLAVDEERFGTMLRRASWFGALIADGVFPPTLAGEATARCAACDYRRACRVDHLRASEVQRTRHGIASPWPSPLRLSELAPPDEDDS